MTTMNKPAHTEDEIVTAFHEAGHAVMYTLMGIPFITVNVFSDKHPAPPDLPGFSGIVKDLAYECWPVWAMAGCPGYHTTRALNYWERWMCILCAGHAAESIYIGRKAPAYIAGLDRSYLDSMRDLMGITTPELRKVWAQRSRIIRAATKRIVSVPEVWDAITTVANRLLVKGTLTEAEVLALLGDSFRSRCSRSIHPISARLGRFARNRVRDLDYQVTYWRATADDNALDLAACPGQPS